MSLNDWSEDELTTAIASGNALLVDLRADWCAQCGPQAQVLERIAPEFASAVTFSTVDVGRYPLVADRFGVSGLPALLLFNNGELQETLCGFKRAPLVRQAMARLIEEGE